MQTTANSLPVKTNICPMTILLHNKINKYNQWHISKPLVNINTGVNYIKP